MTFGIPVRSSALVYGWNLSIEFFYQFKSREGFFLIIFRY